MTEKIKQVDDSKPKSEAARASLLDQLRERQDKVAKELTAWRALGESPEAVRAEIEGRKSEAQDLAKAFDLMKSVNRSQRATIVDMSSAMGLDTNKTHGLDFVLTELKRMADASKAVEKVRRQVKLWGMEERGEIAQAVIPGEPEHVRRRRLITAIVGEPATSDPSAPGG